MPLSLDLIKEGVIVGIALAIIGNIVGYVLKQTKIAHVDVPASCKNWNDKYAMEIALFFTGFFAHLFFEFAGANKWYCRNGYACQ